MRESVIVHSIIKYLNSLPKCVAEKIQGNAIASGRADINACYKGHTLRIEVKTPDHGNKASKKQNGNLQRWTAAGAYCIVAYCIDDVKNLIKSIEKAIENV